MLTSGFFMLWGSLVGRTLPTWTDIHGTIAYIITFGIGMIMIYVVYTRDNKSNLDNQKGGIKK